MEEAEISATMLQLKAYVECLPARLQLDALLALRRVCQIAWHLKQQAGASLGSASASAQPAAQSQAEPSESPAKKRSLSRLPRHEVAAKIRALFDRTVLAVPNALPPTQERDASPQGIVQMANRCSTLGQSLPMAAEAGECIMKLMGSGEHEKSVKDVYDETMNGPEPHFTFSLASARLYVKIAELSRILPNLKYAIISIRGLQEHGMDTVLEVARDGEGWNKARWVLPFSQEPQAVNPQAADANPQPAN